MPTKPGTYAKFNTSEGTVVCELFEKDAPQTVANFIGLAEGSKDWNSRSKKGAKLYDGTIFHRVIPQFMIQGGDPEGTGMGGPGYKFADETKGSPHGFQKPGKLAMANAGPNTNGSQFFITVTDTSWLTGKHTIFGEVVEGYDVVEKISKVSRDGMDRPKTPVVLESDHQRSRASASQQKPARGPSQAATTLFCEAHRSCSLIRSQGSVKSRPSSMPLAIACHLVKRGLDAPAPRST
jgi:peptidyl-prolyl cis-trans isomerase A (cyclophilin A)